MNWTQPFEIDKGRRLGIGVCDTQPIVIEGLKSCLAGSRVFALTDSAGTLEEASRVLIGASPRIMIIDKAMGGPAVLGDADPVVDLVVLQLAVVHLA